MTVVDRLRNRGITPKAVLYARFSSDNQREESIEAQLRAMLLTTSTLFAKYGKIVIS